MLLVRCDTCLASMYRTDGRRVLDCDEGGRVEPILVVVKDKRSIFCSKSCAARWLIKQPIQSLKDGYPLL